MMTSSEARCVVLDAGALVERGGLYKATEILAYMLDVIDHAEVVQEIVSDTDGPTMVDIAAVANAAEVGVMRLTPEANFGRYYAGSGIFRARRGLCHALAQRSADS